MRTRAEDGLASIWVLTGCVLLLLAGIVAQLVLSVGLTHRRAAAAADLAALSAALEIKHGAWVACRTAAQVAAAHGAVLAGCRLGPSIGQPSVTVTVQQPLPEGVSRWVPGPSRSVTATARAG